MDYSKVLVEVDEVLKHLSKSDLAKIPDDIKSDIRKNKSRQWNIRVLSRISLSLSYILI